MSGNRNSGRIGSHGSSGESPVTKTMENLLNFPKPTEFVDLPSKGALYPEGHPLCGVETIEIGFMTGKEEDMLTNVDYIRRGVAIDKVLQNLVSDDIDVNGLLSADKSALVIAARATAYSREYKTQVSCPSCGSTSKFGFDLNNTNVYEGYVEDDPTQLSIERLNDGCFVVTVPLTEVKVKVKLMTGGDEKRMFEIVSAEKKKNKSFNSVSSDTLKQIVLSVNGIDDEETVTFFLENAPAADLAFLREKYKLLNPSIDLMQTYTCDSCGYEEEVEPPIGLDFLYPRS